MTQEWSNATMLGPVTEAEKAKAEVVALKTAIQEAVEAAKAVDRCISACESLLALARRKP